MIRFSPVRLMFLGVILMVYASVTTFLMALRWMPSTYLLNFLAAVSSVVGLTMGLYGLFQQTRPRER
jgi:asparagine N-glycosylation enzyme membrane subunit Stt3